MKKVHSFLNGNVALLPSASKQEAENEQSRKWTEIEEVLQLQLLY